jgi:hypothetical protein
MQNVYEKICMYTILAGEQGNHLLEKPSHASMEIMNYLIENASATWFESIFRL